MKISIAMATYNGEKYLQQQLESFIVQTRLPDELVVCDDGSSDATVSILRDFADRAPFEVRLYENHSNLGFVKNFEKAMNLCSGDIIFLSDQDDVWFDKKLASIIQLFLDNPQKFVTINDQIVTDKNLKQSKATTLGNVRKLGYEDRWFITGCCTAFRKEWLKIINPVPNPIDAHDIWLNRLAYLLELRVVTEEPLQLYRRYDGNVSDAETSDTKKVSRFKLLEMYGLKDSRRGWEQEIASRNEYQKRIAERRDELADFVPVDVIDRSLSDINKKCQAIKRRIGMTSVPRWRRLRAWTSFCVSGDYRHFHGWKSAVKDLIRP